MSTNENDAAGGRDEGGAPREDQGRGRGGAGQRAGGRDLQKEIERSGTDGAGTGGVGEGDLGGPGAAPGREGQF